MRGTTRKSRVLLALALALCLAFTAALPALAAQIPSRPENQYVLDEAGVLSEETKDNINHANRELSRETGACVMVAVVNSLGGEDLDFYTSWMFESWKAGRNGVLLVVALQEKEYQVLAWEGVGDALGRNRLEDLAAAQVEPCFSTGEYEDGIYGFFTEAMMDLAGLDYSTINGPDNPSFWERVRIYLVDNLMQVIVIGAVIVVVLFVLIFVVYLRGGGKNPPGKDDDYRAWNALFLTHLMNRGHGGRKGSPPL